MTGLNGSMFVKPGKPSQRFSVKWHQKIQVSYGTHSPNRKSCNGCFRQMLRAVLDLQMRHSWMLWHLAIRMQTIGILSIMADKASFAKIQEWIPGLTKYRYTMARQHILLHGRGTPVPSESPRTRMMVPQEKLAHFLDFITSPHIIQTFLSEKNWYHFQLKR